MKSDRYRDLRKNEERDDRPFCPLKAGTKNPRCWEASCAIWDRKRRQCSELSRNLAKANENEIEAGRRCQEVMDRQNEHKAERSAPLY